MASNDGWICYNPNVCFKRERGVFVDPKTGHIFIPASVNRTNPRDGYYHTYSAGLTEDPPNQGYTCPYRKHKPDIFNEQDHPSCAFESFFFMEALLEHLHIDHDIPAIVFCPTCLEQFHSEYEAKEHGDGGHKCKFSNQFPPGKDNTPDVWPRLYLNAPITYSEL